MLLAQYKDFEAGTDWVDVKVTEGPAQWLGKQPRSRRFSALSDS